MAWRVELDPALAKELDGIGAIDAALRREILAHARLLEIFGPRLGRPHVDTLKGSRFRNMKELRFNFVGRPWRVLFAFDPRRTAVLLVAGDKGAVTRWYDRNIPLAEARYRVHLRRLEKRHHG